MREECDVKRVTVLEGNEWEGVVGYARAVRLGSTVHVAGTTATDDDGEIVGVGDSYEQAAHILKKIQKALAEAGATMRDVVRTRMYVTDINAWPAVGRAHHEFFADVRPAATLVEVSSLVHPDLMVEIEVEAIVTDGSGGGS
jgi:enamine deaminase RidA (YjgF/YER057c/UK114 family)